jgi:hypothetical protein
MVFGVVEGQKLGIKGQGGVVKTARLLKSQTNSYSQEVVKRTRARKLGSVVFYSVVVSRPGPGPDALASTGLVDLGGGEGGTTYLYLHIPSALIVKDRSHGPPSPQAL